MSGRLRSAAGAATLFATTFSAVALPSPSPSASACAIHAPEAANRSGLPIDVVLRVMMAESGGNPRIVSSKGAIGCMQIMPATWSYLSGRYRLGPDPFDARMNMIGGAMYLAELASRYGWPGALSAYNAGPGRYQRNVQNGAPLPAETIAYTARLGNNAETRPAIVLAPRWQVASLFMTRPLTEGSTAPPSKMASPDAAEFRRSNPLFPLSDGTERGETVAIPR